MTSYFTELQDSLVSRSAALSRPPQRRWTGRSRVLAGAVVLLGGAGGATGLAISATAPGPVANVPADVRAAAPALGKTSTPIPSFVRESFDNAPEETVNPSLARPLAAGLPDAPVSWVAPTANGACLAVPDTFHSIAVVCATTSEIEQGNLAIQTYKGNPETGPGTEVGVGGTPDHPETDGSFSRHIAAKP